MLPLVLVSVVAPADERPVAKVRFWPVEIVVVVPAFHDDVSPSTAPMVSALLPPLVKLTERLVLAKAKVSTAFALLVSVIAEPAVSARLATASAAVWLML